ncbi:MAG: hypothetical protein HY681_08130 [Chloroflexi bacterium]|nr:hypothetical protein [Chloroflexota bacterium]
MKWKLWSVVLGMLVLLVGAGGAFGVTRSLKGAPQQSVVIGSPGWVWHSDYDVAKSLGEQAHSAQVILIGTVKSLGGIVNTARDPANPSLPHLDIFGVGQLYQIEVDEYLKGSGPTSIDILQVENYLNLARKSQESRANPGRKGPGPDSMVLQPGVRYLFFLQKRENRSHYSQAMEPYRYALVGTRAKPEGAFKASSKALPERDAAELLNELRGLLER